MPKLFPIRNCFKVIILSLSCLLLLGVCVVSAQSITKFFPASATPGTMVTIVGTGLSSVTSVKFCGFPDSALIIGSDDTIYARVGTNCEAQAPGYITLVSPGGNATSVSKFTPVPLPPTITGFYPDSCKYGDTVTIIGTHLVNVTLGCSIVGFYAAHVIGVSVDTLKLVVLDGDPTQKGITVNTTGGTASAWGIVYMPLPIITAFSPDIAGPGQPVTITGSNFEGLSKVTFGGVAAQSFQLTSPTTIVAYPASGASGQIIVTANGGSVGKAGFVFIPPAKPTITSFTPTSAAKDSTVIIKGTNLTAATAVSFGGVPAGAFTVVDATTITAVVGSVASGSVSVTTPGGTASLDGFIFGLPPAPVITGFYPTSGTEGTLDTIVGMNLSDIGYVSFGGVSATSITIISPTMIAAVVGQGASGPVEVISSTTNRSATYNWFTYTGPTPPPTPPVMHAPVLSGFTPTHAAQGATVTISGAYLDSVSSVSFGGVTAQSFTVVSSGMIRAVVGAGASGNIFVGTRLANDNIGGFLFDETPPPAVSAPFQLVQFSGTAYSNQPVLSWSVKHDSSIANYGILHGTDTSHLTFLTNILAKWKDTTNYTFTDINSSSGVNYYRLQITDIRMNITYSPVISVQLAGVSPTLTMYPNPVTGSYVTVNLPSVTAPSQFQVVDMSGNVVQLVPVAAGTPQVKIRVMNMNRGMYKIIWSDGNNVSYQTVLILK